MPESEIQYCDLTGKKLGNLNDLRRRLEEMDRVELCKTHHYLLSNSVDNGNTVLNFVDNVSTVLSFTLGCLSTCRLCNPNDTMQSIKEVSNDMLPYHDQTPKEGLT